jgi:hypothetical protein
MLVSSKYFRDLAASLAVEPIRPDVHLDRKIWLYIAAAVLAAMLLLHRQLWTAWVWLWN